MHSDLLSGLTKKSHHLFVGEVHLTETTTWSDIEANVQQLLQQHWSEMCVAPTIHSPPAYIYLSGSMQALFGDKLKAKRLSQTSTPSGDQVRSPEHSFGSRSSSAVASTMSLSQLSVAHVDNLGLEEGSVLRMSYGDSLWTPSKAEQSTLPTTTPWDMWTKEKELLVALQGKKHFHIIRNAALESGTPT